jgi:hypothetical protein
MEMLTLAIVRKVRRRLRQQFFKMSGKYRNMAVLLVYEFSGPSVPGGSNDKMALAFQDATVSAGRTASP